MNEERKQEINKAVCETFAAIGLDYDSPEMRIVPLLAIVTSNNLFVKELPKDKSLNQDKLTAERAVDFIKQKMGLKANNHLTRTNELSGFIYVMQTQREPVGCIFTDTGEITTRRRFSAAHELGHYLLHFLPQAASRKKSGGDGFSIFTEGVSFTDSAEAKDTAEIKIVSGYEERETIDVNGDEMETEANFFAAELLMPRNACLALAQTYTEKFGASKTVVVRRLASEFLVSFEAMLRRLKNLGFYER